MHRRAAVEGAVARVKHGDGQQHVRRQKALHKGQDKGADIVAGGVEQVERPDGPGRLRVTRAETASSRTLAAAAAARTASRDGTSLNALKLERRAPGSVRLTMILDSRRASPC